MGGGSIEDLFKRGLFAYIGLTMMFWFMHFGMIANGANYARNPTWQLIETIKSRLTWAAVLGAGVTLFAWISLHVQGVLSDRRERESERQEKIVAAQEAERWRERQEQRRSDESLYELRKEEERKAKMEELRRQFEIERQQRTAEDAASKALSDF